MRSKLKPSSQSKYLCTQGLLLFNCLTPRREKEAELEAYRILEKERALEISRLIPSLTDYQRNGVAFLKSLEIKRENQKHSSDSRGFMDPWICFTWLSKHQCTHRVSGSMGFRISTLNKYFLHGSQ